MIFDQYLFVSYEVDLSLVAKSKIKPFALFLIMPQIFEIAIACHSVSRNSFSVSKNVTKQLYYTRKLIKLSRNKILTQRGR